MTTTRECPDNITYGTAEETADGIFNTMAALVLFVLSALFVDLAGYWLHRLAHSKVSGPMYRAHMTHHVVNYPPRAFFSPTYRTSGSDSLIVWFAPFMLVYIGVVVAVFHPIHILAILAGAAFTSVASSVAHDLTHVTGSIVWRRKRFLGITVRHHAHHFKMSRNFGILIGLWDRIFRTRRGPIASQGLPLSQPPGSLRSPDDGR